MLSLCGLAEVGRFEPEALSASALENVERYRSRVQATYAPSGWGGLRVRAAWSPSHEEGCVDLEVQAHATSVGLLHKVEVVVETAWGDDSAGSPGPGASRVVEPRDAIAAMLSYDGREPSESLCELATLPIRNVLGPQVVIRPRSPSDMAYAEMAVPDDVARRIRIEPRYKNNRPTGSRVLRHTLFGHDMEKGVVFRARLRGGWLAGDLTEKRLQALYERFVVEPPPLGP
jgi:hypothetical protein